MRRRPRGRAICGPGHCFRAMVTASRSWGNPPIPARTGPVRYIATIRTEIQPAVFERAIDNFLTLVLSGLDAVGLDAVGLDAVGLDRTELHALWHEVVDERRGEEGASNRMKPPNSSCRT